MGSVRASLPEDRVLGGVSRAAPFDGVELVAILACSCDFLGQGNPPEKLLLIWGQASILQLSY